MKKIGFIGVGKMGRGMCENIIKKGHQVTVYDRKPEALDYFSDKASTAASHLEVLQASDIIIFSLPNSEEVESACMDFLEQDVTGKFIVDASTSYPESTKMLYAKFKQAGCQFIDAPLNGSPAHTAAGNAPCMISGDKDAVDKVMDVVGCYATPIDYFGDIGNAHIIKISMNFVGLMYAALAAQTFPLLEKFGIDAKNIFNIMNNGGFGNPIFNFYGRKFVEQDYHLDFSLELALKDMNYMRRLYDKFNVPAFLLDGGLNLMREAVKEGRGKRDTSEICALVRDYLELDK